MTKKEKAGLGISARSFIVAIAVIFVLMVITYLLTLFIPGGHYARVDGRIVSEASFESVQGGIPFWKWLLSPFLILAADGSTTIIAVLIFLIVIGGVFSSLNACGLMKYMLEKLVFRFGHTRYRLMAVIMLFFMALGSLIGSFEECVPLVPLVVALSVSLGWDAVTGLSMSLLSVGCGFAAGVFNPFTVGTAQELAGVPMFSGAWLRAVAFVLIYALLYLFTYWHAKKVEKPLAEDKKAGSGFQKDARMDRALFCFAGLIGFGIALVLASAFITVLQDYTLILVAVMFLAAGISSSLLTGMSAKELCKTFGAGVVGMLPAVLMILMASSIRYTLEQANVLDTILHHAVLLAGTMPRVVVILFVYLIVLVMNFFIASGSAKAFMLIPLIVPLADVFGISAQLCIMAYAFGDGFSNIFYPTNPVLLISLGLADISYGKWVKWSWKFQLANLVLTSAVLLVGLAIGY